MSEFDDYKDNIVKKVLVRGATGVVGLFTIIGALASYTTINSGERGVRVTLGKVSEEGPLQPGLHFKLPIIQDIVRYSVRTNKLSFETNAFTKDVQNVKLKITINYNLEPKTVNSIYKEYGKDIESLVITPTVLDVIKNDLGKREAVKLIENREESSEAIEQMLKKELIKRHVIIQDFRYEDIDFSDVFEEAIERKVVAEQETLTQQHISEQEEKKADQAVIRAGAEAKRLELMANAEATATLTRANAEAKALSIKGKALKENPEIIHLEQVNKWNGELPRVITSGKNAIFDLGNIVNEQKQNQKN